MPVMKTTTLRLNSAQCEMLEQLAEKLQITEVNVIRVAISRLAEAEGIVLTKKRVQDV